MLNGYYYENIGDHVNQDFSLWHVDSKYAKLMMRYENDFGNLILEKNENPLRIYNLDEVGYHLEEGIQDGVVGEVSEGLAKKILGQNSPEKVKAVLDEFFRR
jgi:hypothetical protein